MKSLRHWLTLIWELPLFCLSLLWFRLIRAQVRRIANRLFEAQRLKSESGEQKPEWRGLSETLEGKGGLAYMMVTGPRWNCHALLGNLGPLSVKAELELDLDTANQSAMAWTFVLYRNQHETVAHIGSSDPKNQGGRYKVTLPAGTYRLVCRYYHPAPQSWLPETWVDGKKIVSKRLMDQEWEKYQAKLQTIRGNQTWFYRLMHLYTWVMLRHQRLFSASWIQREYLPIGNPETQFRYGALCEGQSLRVQFPPRLLEQFDLYLVLLNLASFPEYWTQLLESGQPLPPMRTAGTYLIRIHLKHATQAPPEGLSIQIEDNASR